MMRVGSLSRVRTASRLLFAATLLAWAVSTSQAAPVLTTGIFNSPGQASQFNNPATPDGGFIAAGGTEFESFGVEGSNLSGQRLRFNALTGPNTFTFSVAKNTTFSWVSGRRYDFTESYSGDATKQLSFSITDTVTNAVATIPTYTTTYGGVKSLIFRQRTPTSNGAVTFQNLSLGSTSFSDVITLTNNGTNDQANYFQIANFDFTQAWTLTGSVTMSWTGTQPNGTSLAWQIKGWQKEVEVNPVPEPSTIASAAVASFIGLAHVLRSRRRRGIA